MQNLLLYYSRNHKNPLSLNLFQEWLDICHSYTLHNLSAEQFSKKNKVVSSYSFYLKNHSYPLTVKSNCYLSARLLFWKAFRNRKKLQSLSFYHDRLLSKIEISVVSSASPIGLSKVSILQQKNVR